MTRGEEWIRRARKREVFEIDIDGLLVGPVIISEDHPKFNEFITVRPSETLINPRWNRETSMWEEA